MPGELFSDLTDVYEAMIDWPNRLAHEERFYRRLFERVGVRSVVDVACGTGHHAAMFHSWGLRVEGADISPAMIECARAIAQMLAAVRPGGAIVVHVLNLGHLPDGPCVWQKAKRAALAQGEALILKGVHRCGSRGYVELIVTELSGGKPLWSESVPFLGLEAGELEEMARRGGAAQAAFFAGYQAERYQPHRSVDLVMVAEKRAGG
jgi:SAM-dependent methyltransferase